MRTIKLYGELGKKFGKIHRLMVKTPAEAIRALCANFPEFEKELAHAHERNIGYKVFNGRYQLGDVQEARDPATKVIKIVPAIMGAGATTRILIGAALIVIGAVATATGVGAGAAPYLFAAGTSLILGGVIELLSPVPKIKEPKESAENQPSYIFNGPVNTTAQGHPVPIGYGRLRVGGGLVSAGINIDQIMAGYRRVRVERTTTREYFMNDGTLFLTFASPAEPANVYRRELVTFTKDGYTQPFGGTETYDKYLYTLYYYEIVQELVPT